jgi:hypothetical protein
MTLDVLRLAGADPCVGLAAGVTVGKSPPRPPGVTVVPGTPGADVDGTVTVTVGTGVGVLRPTTTKEMLASAGDMEAAETSAVTVSCCPIVADLAIRSVMFSP